MTGTERPRNIFGTDGIRDRAGEGWLRPDPLFRLGVSLAERLRRLEPRPRVLFGRDPRSSGPGIERVLARALSAGECRVETAGILPTPAVSLLVADEGYDLGIVISASHNPPEDNGVKLFGPDGSKLEPAEEEAITAGMFESDSSVAREGIDPRPRPDLRQNYLERLLNVFPPGALRGLRVVLDCAWGSTAVVAEEAFRRLGADVTAICSEPAGGTINQGCGSLHPEALGEEVARTGADLGVAFDGDGDRAILCDESGDVVDGDEVIVLWALNLRDEERLPSPRVVVTVMSNAGMESYLREQGIDVVRTPVGDREVARTLRAEEAVLGGEQSGHIIYLPEAPTGDGLRTGLHVARIVASSGRSLAELRRPIPRFPQRLLGVETRHRPPLESIPELAALQASADEHFAGRGRVFLRYSGTEPLLRILVEGPDANENRVWADRFAELVRQHPRLQSAAD